MSVFIQLLSLGILCAAGAALLFDFVQARRQLTRALVAWRTESRRR